MLATHPCSRGFWSFKNLSQQVIGRIAGGGSIGVSPSVHQAVRIQPMVGRSVPAGSSHDHYSNSDHTSAATPDGFAMRGRRQPGGGDANARRYFPQQGSRLVGQSAERLDASSTSSVRDMRDCRRVKGGEEVGRERASGASRGGKADAAESATVGDEWKEACTAEGKM